MLNESQLIGFAATANANAARDFYEHVLGLTFVSDDQFALVFDANGTMLRIQKVDKVDPHRYTALGWAVIDIAKQVGEFSEKGVRFGRYEGLDQDELGIWHAPSGARIAWFTDPDGNTISLTQF